MTLDEHTANALQVFSAEQHIHNTKVDMILEQVIKQGQSFEMALQQFQSVVTTTNTAIIRLQDKVSVTEKVVNVVGSIVLLVAGSVLGQFIHFKPF